MQEWMNMGTYIVLLQLAWFSCFRCDEQGPVTTGLQTHTFTPNPDTFLNAPQLIAKYGYPVETHTVQTEDGYILNMFRIPYGKKSPATPNKPAVILHHGLGASADIWLVLGPQKALGYVLADAGYDVWLANARGSAYSEKHATLSTKDKKYWDFSWHEMGVYDLPAEIDYILHLTKQRKLFFVGHSMGNTVFYVMASTRPEYNEKIRAMVSLAPAAFLTHYNSPMKMIFPYVNYIEQVANMIGIYGVPPTNRNIQLLGANLCNDYSATQAMCKTFTDFGYGLWANHVNMTEFHMYLGHVPAGLSLKTAIHYSQSAKSNRFRQYDHGVADNLGRYGRMTPPDYNLQMISAPMYFYYGDSDHLSDTRDVKMLYKHLPNGIGKLIIKDYDHVDFLLAADVKTMVYDKLIAVMKNY